MGNIINFSAVCRPSAMMRRMLLHSGDVSEGTQDEIIARRQVLGRKVTFYRNGRRSIEGTGLTDQDMYDSEILRFAHASILVDEPVGDKSKCYVDATRNPIEIWICGMKLGTFLQKSKELVETQQLDAEFLLEEPVSKVVESKNGRNVRLFGR